MKKYGILLVVLLTAFRGWGQNDYLKFTDYTTARPLINPATMGVEEGVGGLVMYQTSFESSSIRPSLGAFNLNSSIRDKGLAGGVTALYDKYGPYQKVSAYVALSYKLKVNEGKHLFFGLQAGVNYVSNDPSKYHWDEEEPGAMEQISLERILSSAMKETTGAIIVYRSCITFLWSASRASVSLMISTPLISNNSPSVHTT